jgi:hypothetical protein
MIGSFLAFALVFSATVCHVSCNTGNDVGDVYINLTLSVSKAIGLLKENNQILGHPNSY